MLRRLGWLFEELYVRYADFSKFRENDFLCGKFVSRRFRLFVGGDLTGENIVRRFGPNGTSYNDIELIAADVGPVEMYRVNHHGSAQQQSMFVDHRAPSYRIQWTSQSIWTR